MIDVSSDDYANLAQVTAAIRAHLNTMPELRDVEDTRPLPGIEWDLAINRELASRFGANAQSIGTAVQLVTNGILVGKYRPDDAHDEVDIRVRYPKQFRGIHALDGLRVATADGGMVPISNFVTHEARATGQLDRARRRPSRLSRAREREAGRQRQCRRLPRSATWIDSQHFPRDVRVSFTGGAQQQDESGAFLGEAAFMALFLIAIVLLALFNSFYHAVLILIAVVLAMIGSLLGMVVMGQSFSIIMTGTGMLALAGIVVNHNIVLIDTFHRLRDSGMDPIEAVIRASAQRLRPVFLTTIVAIARHAADDVRHRDQLRHARSDHRRAERADVGAAFDRDRVRPGLLEGDHAGPGAGDAGPALSHPRAARQRAACPAGCAPCSPSAGPAG